MPATPSTGSAAASKDYVDSVAAGLDPKESVRVATTAAGTLATDFAAGETVDGVVLAPGDRILIKDQADASENGSYGVQAEGAPARAADHDGTPANEVSGGNFTFVEQGTVNANAGWVLTGDGVLTPGTDDQNWTQFTGAGSFTSGLGIGQSGSTIFLDTDELATATADALDTIAFFDASAVPSTFDPGMRKTTISSLFTSLNVLTNAAGENALLASDGVRIDDSGLSLIHI